MTCDVTGTRVTPMANRNPGLGFDVTIEFFISDPGVAYYTSLFGSDSTGGLYINTNSRDF
jgi:hypothetical protein